MKKLPLFVALAAGLIGGLLGVWLFGAKTAQQAHKETAYERVMRTNTLRCGYYMFKPMSWKDPNTGEMKGMVVDVAREIEKRSGIKVEFTEEVTFGTMYEGLNTGRYDAICTPGWPDAKSARIAHFGKPWFYSVIVPIVAENQKRITSVSQINSPDVTIVTHEGDADDTLARTRFPKAKIFSIAQSGDTSQMEADIFTGKADVILSDANRIYQVNGNHGNDKLRILDNHPLQLFPLPMAVHKGDEQLMFFLDEVMDTLHYDGTMDRILDTYAPGPDAYVRVARPYAPFDQKEMQ